MIRNCRRPKRRGAMLLLVAVIMVILMIAVAFSVDVAYMQLTRMELRSAVDAATRAGVEALSREQDATKALTRAKEVALLNRVAGVPFDLPDTDVTFGRVAVSQDSASVFQPNQGPFNALQITSGRTDGRPGGPIPLFLGGFIGTSSFQPMQTATAAQLDRDMALVLDRSGSMSDDGKFEALKTAVGVFMDELDATPQIEQVSLQVYDVTAEQILEMTSDTAAARTAMTSADTGGGTAIGLGLRSGVNSLKNDDNRRPLAEPTIVLMTDGRHNTDIDPEDILPEIPANFKLHTITFGSNAEKKRMEDLAAARDGKHFHAPTNQALIDVFREIGATLPVVMTK